MGVIDDDECRFVILVVGAGNAQRYFAGQAPGEADESVTVLDNPVRVSYQDAYACVLLANGQPAHGVDKRLLIKDGRVQVRRVDIQ
jgi:hypothetical protein